MDLDSGYEWLTDRVDDGLDALNNAYFAIEDRYYDFLDAVNERIPIYKALDPIDQFVPSLVLFAGILLLLLASGAWFLFLSPADSGFSGPIAASLADQLNSPSPTGDLAALPPPLRNRDGSGSDGSVPLLPLDEGTKSFALQFVNAENGELITYSEVFFAALCDPYGQLEPASTQTGQIVVRMPSSCTTAYFSVNAAGFEMHSESIAYDQISFTTKTIALEPLPAVPQGISLPVIVKTADLVPVANASVSVQRRSDSSPVNWIPSGSGYSGNDGKIVFSLVPGHYLISGFDPVSGKFGSLETALTEPDQNRVLVLDTAGEAKAIFFKVVNTATQEAVPSADFSLYLGNAWLLSNQTNATGEFFQVITAPVGTDSVKAVIRKTGFVSKVVSIDLSEMDSASPVIISLTPKTLSNSSAVLGHAEEKETGIPVKDATAWLFHSQLQVPMNPEGILTDSDGNALWDSLPATRFDLIVTHPDFSDANLLNQETEGGKTKFLTLPLQRKNTGFVVAVTDRETGNEVDGAEVTAIDPVTGDALDENSTIDGLAQIGKIPLGKEVFFRVSKSDYLTYWSETFTGIPNQLRRVEIQLSQKTGAPDLVLDQVFESDKITVARTLEKNQAYWIQFRLQLPSRNDSYPDVLTYVRDAVSDIRIENFESSLLPNRVVFSQDATEFAFQTGTETASNSHAKQVNVAWGNLNAGEFVFRAKISFDSSAEGTQHLSFGVRAFNPVDSPYGPVEHEQTWDLGSVICTLNCTGQPDFVWSVFLVPQGNPKPALPLDLSSGGSVELNQNQPYSIWMALSNYSTASITNADIVLNGSPFFSAGPQQQSLPFTILSGQSIPMAGFVEPQDPFSVVAQSSADSGFLEFELIGASASATGTTLRIPVVVTGSKRLQVSFKKDALNQKLTVSVQDGTSAVPLAGVPVSYNAGVQIASSSPVSAGISDSAGLAEAKPFQNGELLSVSALTLSPLTQLYEIPQTGSVFSPEIILNSDNPPQSVSIQAKVISDSTGNPVAGAAVLYWSDKSMYSGGTTDSSGIANLVILQAGQTVLVKVSLAGFDSVIAPFLVPSDSTVFKPVVSIIPSTPSSVVVTGQILDQSQSNQALADVMVSYSQNNQSFPGGVTDSGGNAFPVTLHQGESFSMTANKPGFQSVTQTFSVPSTGGTFSPTLSLVLDQSSGTNLVSAKVLQNPQNVAVANATVKIQKMQAPQIPVGSPDWVLTTTANGTATFPDFLLGWSEFAVIEVTASDYKRSFFLLRGSEFNSFRPAEGFSCLKLTPWTAWQNPDLPVSEPALPGLQRQSQSKTLYVDASKCSENIEFHLGVWNDLADDTQVSWSPSGDMTVLAGEIKPVQIQFSPRSPLGVIPIAVYVKRAQSGEWQFLSIVDIYSLDSAAEVDQFG